MQQQNRPEQQGRWVSLPLNHVQHFTACVIMALAVCGEGVVHRKLSDTGAPEELQPSTDHARNPSFVTGGPGSGGGNISLPVELTHSFEAIPQLSISDGEFEKRQEDGQEKGRVPQCYSSPTADPSEGEWRKTRGGVSESPAMRENWAFPSSQFHQLERCKQTWEEKHSGDQDYQPYWVWEPKHCALKAVTAAGFCGVMEGRKGVLLVGDSLTRLFTTTLASILRAKSVSVDLMGDEWLACEGKLAVRFVRNDYLDVRTRPFDTVECNSKNGEPYTRCRMFADSSTLSQFDTLVVNSGAHTRPREIYGPIMKFVSVSLAASMRSIHGDDAILVVRNTVPGHWGCTERMFDGPVNSSVATDLVNAAPPAYKWHNFLDYNMLLKKAFLPEQGWRLLDAFSPTLLRPDSHLGGKDCLHYCLPGPADHWIVLFYNILLASSTGQ